MKFSVRCKNTLGYLIILIILGWWIAFAMHLFFAFDKEGLLDCVFSFVLCFGSSIAVLFAALKMVRSIALRVDVFEDRLLVKKLCRHPQTVLLKEIKRYEISTEQQKGTLRYKMSIYYYGNAKVEIIEDEMTNFERMNSFLKNARVECICNVDQKLSDDSAILEKDTDKRKYKESFKLLYAILAAGTSGAVLPAIPSIVRYSDYSFSKSYRYIALNILVLLIFFIPFTQACRKVITIGESEVIIKSGLKKSAIKYEEIESAYYSGSTSLLSIYTGGEEKKVSLKAFEDYDELLSALNQYISIEVV